MMLEKEFYDLYENRFPKQSEASHICDHEVTWMDACEANNKWWIARLKKEIKEAKRLEKENEKNGDDDAAMGCLIVAEAFENFRLCAEDALKRGIS